MVLAGPTHNLPGTYQVFNTFTPTFFGLTSELQADAIGSFTSGDERLFILDTSLSTAARTSAIMLSQEGEPVFIDPAKDPWKCDDPKVLGSRPRSICA
jgi:hypothetical protein